MTKQLLLTASRILPRPSTPVEDGAVLVEGERILAAGPRAEVVAQAPPDAERLDFPGATLLPGLFNAHVHLAFDATREMLPNFLASDDEALRAGAKERLGQLLRSGVTTVRDLGDRGALGARVRSELEGAVAPRLLTAGSPLTVLNGHCHFFGGEVDGDDAIRALIDANAAAGADVIKVMASGGQITEGGADMWESQFDVRALRLIVEHAGRHGLPVAAHAHGSDAIEASVEAGVATIEHCTWMTGPQRQDRREGVAKRMAAEGIAACSTSSRNWRMLAERMGEELAKTVYGRLSWLEELGVPLLAGTDAGLPGSVFDDPVGALELYEWLGFGRRRILEIATEDSAAGLGLGDVTGRLAPGLSADVLVVDGDPLADLSALRNLRLVLSRGLVVSGVSG
ncbi:amidohydrolase family protein [Amycolatopsis keratiniphila]|uniref:amidohydrolase family protein n=1 Tax=Amycolatopsis keratiniphila TaxID=129921 RepID=UPI00087AD198|nr:amidohydrolase family protein [Amycolatopsis keratiniphila]OLZ57047.1 amidohydrolase [Amycolatopsis keratiniphila subsp. nogabecina]SDU49588.1 Imidazolonepropionase [Amycolatopsis keratiniphila]